MSLFRKYDLKTFFEKQLFTLKNLYYCAGRQIPFKTAFFCDLNVGILPKGTLITHAHGICIQPHTVFGANVRICQGVTIGKRNLRMLDIEPPAVIGDNVVLGANSTILGAVKIGDNATIGAHALILKDVPVGVTVTGLWK